MGELMQKSYDLHERSYVFARDVAVFVRTLSRSMDNAIYAKQVIRSSSSVGANYLEASDALGKQDRLMRMRISRKEARETVYWLRLIKSVNQFPDNHICSTLLKEAHELRLIFSTIIQKLEKLQAD